MARTRTEEGRGGRRRRRGGGGGVQQPGAESRPGEFGRWHRGEAGQRVWLVPVSIARRGYQKDLELSEGFNCQLRPLLLSAAVRYNCRGPQEESRTTREDREDTESSI